MNRVHSLAAFLGLFCLAGCEASRPAAGPAASESAPAVPAATSTSSADDSPAGEVTLITLNVPNMT